MIQRIAHSRLPLLVYQPPKVFDLAYAVACHRAGTLPVLDTEFLDPEDAIGCLEGLGREAVRFGLRLSVRNAELIAYIKENAIANLDLLIFAYSRPEDLDDLHFDSRDGRFLIEALDIQLDPAIRRLAPHGIVVRGNEAPGRVSTCSSFILMQWYLENSDLPVAVHGGVGLHSAAGMLAAGASALVLDSQLYLARQAPVAPGYQDLIRGLGEKDTALVGLDLGVPHRCFARLGTRIVRELKKKEIALAGTADGPRTLCREIEVAVAAMNETPKDPGQTLFFLGQDAVFAKHFARCGPDLDAMIGGLFERVRDQLQAVDDHNPLRADALLAREHGTRYPIIQGPMANISDNVDFAKAVLDNGGLPFLAMGSLPPEKADQMLEAGARRLERFGAGLIGMAAVNKAVDAHMASVKKHRAPFALFAGGTPAQVRALEDAGIRTYLHAPAMAILDNAMQSGLNRFIFEGSEAGGHVGALSSLVLWELAVEKMSHLDDAALQAKRLVFAGGIGTPRAAHFIAGLTAGLAARGAGIGIQVGTAYLFTREIVATGAVKRFYQELICRCSATIVIGQTVGLSSRTVATPFSRRMLANEHQRILQGAALTERKSAFERENIGSLLIGAKGFCPDFSSPGEVCMLDFDEDGQYENGNFMVGDALAFYPTDTTIADLHTTFFRTEDRMIRTLNALEVFSNPVAEINDEIAVIGMGCIYPDADSPQVFWENVLGKKYSIAEMPAERLDPSLYYAQDRQAADKTYTRLAGAVQDYNFDGARYGYTEEKARRISRSQQMLLDSAYQAVADAGCLDADRRLRAGMRRRAAVIVGSCLGNERGNDFYLKYWYPELHYHLDQIEAFQTLTESEKRTLLDSLRNAMAKGVDYEPVHGWLLNIEAARIAHHLGIQGLNYVVDAACASSFAALDCAVRELLSGECDLVITGGVNTHLTPEFFVGFSKMGALSARGSYPFDARADGFVLGEGAGVVVLKRLKDAVRDGDRIHGVIKAVGSSSDGKGRAVAAPNPEGQLLASQRCYAKAKTPLSPAQIGYIEAHGTGTPAGDAAEIEALKRFYRSDAPIGISSVKSQIGHLLGGAGYAGLIKALLAIRHRTLPPNGRFESPAPAHLLEESPLFIIAEAAPWESAPATPRRAAVSSYGFGGVNYHLVVEEYLDAYRPVPRALFPDPGHDAEDDRIVFAGLGAVLPGSPDAAGFWENIVAGGSMVSDLPEDRFHSEYYAMEEPDSSYHIPQVRAGVAKDFHFDHLIFRIPPAVVPSIDRAQRLALEAARQAVASAQLSPHLAWGNRVGVIVGTLPGTRQVENVLRVRLGFIEGLIRAVGGIGEETREQLIHGLTGRIRGAIVENNEDTVPGYLSNIVAGRIANFFGCNGANFAVDAACASAFVATRLAVRALRSGDLDFVITGGADANLYPTAMLAFKRMGLLSDDEGRFFDNRAKGYVMSEGAALQVLTTYGRARALGLPVLGEIKGMAMTSSAPGHLLKPSERSYAEAIQGCYRNLPFNADQIDYLDVFGVSHVALDMVEKQAIESCFTAPVAFGNIKSEFGYFKAANPAVVLTRLALMAHHRQLPPHHSYCPESSLVGAASVLKPTERLTDLSRRRTLLLAANVNGVGGLHGHAVVGTLPPWLDASAGAAGGAPEPPGLPEVVRQTVFQPCVDGIAALLPGQGAQYGGMLQAAYTKMPGIRAMLDRGDRIFSRMRNVSLLDIMFGGGNALNRTENTQPAMFLSTAAIFDHFKRLGFAPDGFIGHSVGEYSALYCSGMLDFDTAMELVVKRADFMKTAADAHPGAIMVVFKGPDDTLRLIRESGIAGIWVANKNSEGQTAVSGETGGIDAFCTWLKSRNLIFKKLPLSGAFHTPLFESAADRMAAHLGTLAFNAVDFSRVVSNVTARPYPDDAGAVKTLLARQIVSPVEFIAAVKNAHGAGFRRFYEIGVGRILVNLLKNISVDGIETLAAVHPDTQDETFSLGNMRRDLLSRGLIQAPAEPPAPTRSITPEPLARRDAFSMRESPPARPDDGFDAFLEENDARIREMLYGEYQRSKREQALAALEQFNFYTGRLVVAGAAIGLPGTASRVFSADNFQRLLQGVNCIEPLSATEKQKIVDLNITRVFKQPDGNARFQKISDTRDVIQLAGQLGYFDLRGDYGVDFDYDITASLAMAAGIEALKDAHIPLVRRHRATSTGSLIPDGHALPRQMQETTGVIMTALFPGFDTLIAHLEKYYYDRFFMRPYEELEKIYYHIMASPQDRKIKSDVTDWFFKLREQRKRYDAYAFDRNLLLNIMPLGPAYFAQLIQAKGPNMVVSGACASTTQALGVAEDWIRTGRCERVVVIGGEAPTSELQNRWIGSGFLALGAASVKSLVTEAAKPFDAARNGTILGSGAVGIIVEREDRIQERGLCGQAEILGTCIGNSAFHATRVDTGHIADAMERFVRRTEIRHGLDRGDYTGSMVFMSHETFTPARGGSASAEITALRQTFPEHYRSITVTNTKGHTGHTLGAALEDAVLIKALQMGQVPPIANLQRVPDEFADIHFAAGGTGDYSYGLHFSAGFGSQFALLFIRRIQERDVRNNPAYQAWLQRISGLDDPAPELLNNTLCLEAASEKTACVICPEAEAESVNPQERAALGAGWQTSREAPAVDGDTVIPKIRAVIAEQTGYAEDMLEAGLDLEADLGIDTVKHVEIFGKIARAFDLTVPGDLKLRELNTIERLAAFVLGKMPAAPTAAPETPVPAAAPPEADDAPAIQKIRAVIAEQTGYAEDMLEAGLDLEADLGIDTVKHVEIFGKIARAFDLTVPGDLKLRELNTIERLAAFVAAKPAAVPSAPQPMPGAPAGNPWPPPSGVRRFEVAAVPLPAPLDRGAPLEGRTLLITSLNGDGVCDLLTAKFRSLGAVPILLSGIDFSDPTAVGAGVEKVRADVPEIDGFIHLVPLEGVLGGEGLNRARIRTAVKSFFWIVKALHQSLNRPGSLIAMPSVGSLVLPYLSGHQGIDPVFGGVAGMMKTVNKEFSAARVKAVDLEPGLAAAEIVETFIAELLNGDQRVEIGYRAGTRYGLSLVEADPVPGVAIVRDGDTVLVTGGAVGVTFEILKALAQRFRLRLIILARSDVDALDPLFAGPDADESFIMDKLKTAMTGAPPVQIRRACRSIVRLRTARANLGHLAELGADVHYHAVDVTDAGAVAGTVRRYGRIDGVLHGAGVEESQWLWKKTTDAFDRVFDTKVAGTRNLLNALDGRSWRFFIAFSSVTARLGNPGQVDYTGANEMMGKMLLAAVARDPSRIVKIFDWTAWEGVGMAAQDTVRKVLGERGLTFLSVEAGVNHFMQELHCAAPAEVMFCARDAAFDADGLFAARATADSAAGLDWPFIDTLEGVEGDERIYVRTLDLKRDRFLFDHSREGVPILPAAAGIEAMAEAAATRAGTGAMLQEIIDFTIPYGIKILKGRPRKIRIAARPHHGADADTSDCRISSRFRPPRGGIPGQTTLHYRGTFAFGDAVRPLVRVDIPEFEPPPFAGDFQALLYHPARLFMDGLFKTVEAILSFEPDRIVARVRSSSDRPYFSDAAAPRFLTDIAVMDAMFQTGGMLEAMTANAIFLPSGAGRMRFLKPVKKGKVYWCITRRMATGPQVHTYRLQLVEPNGVLCIDVSEYQMVRLEKIAEPYRIQRFLMPPVEQRTAS